jgi:hypothetical protein
MANYILCLYATCTRVCIVRVANAWYGYVMQVCNRRLLHHGLGKQLQGVINLHKATVRRPFYPGLIHRYTDIRYR